MQIIRTFENCGGNNEDIKNGEFSEPLLLVSSQRLLLRFWTRIINVLVVGQLYQQQPAKPAKPVMVIAKNIRSMKDYHNQLIRTKEECTLLIDVGQ